MGSEGTETLVVDNSILDWEPPAQMVKDLPYYLSGHDKEGRPVWVHEFGKWDLKSIINSDAETIENFDKYTKQCFKKWTESSKKLPNDPGFVLISDLEGYSLTQANSIAAVQKYLWIVRAFVAAVRDGNNFHRATIVNANQLFVTAFNLSKPLFGDVINNIGFYGTGNEEWKVLFEKEIAADQLVEKYGGTQKR